MTKIISEAEFENEVLKSPQPVLVDFFATWCVDPDTSVLTNEMDHKKAREILFGSNILSYTKDKLVRSKTLQSKTASDKGHCVYLETETGREIKVTDDHQFFTQNNWKEAKNLKVGELVAVYPIFEKLYTEKRTDIVLDEKIIRTLCSSVGISNQYLPRYTERLKRKGLIPLTFDNDKILILARLMGELFSDGNLYKNKSNNYREISFSLGQTKDADQIIEDLKILGFECHRYKLRKREGKILGRTFISKEYKVKCCSTALWLLFRALGVPEGNKTDCNYTVPKWIMNGSQQVKREFLRGYLGGDGPKPTIRLQKSKSRKSHDHFFLNDVEFHKREDLIGSGIRFACQIKKLLETFGVKVRKVFNEDEKYIRKNKTKTKIIHIGFHTDYETGYNLCKIGYCYSRQKQLSALYVGEFLRKRLYERKMWLEKYSDLIMHYKKGLSIKELAERFGISKDTIFGWIKYMKQPMRKVHKEKFSNWYRVATKGLKEGLVWERILKIDPIYLPTVQVITVDKSHNFFANGFLVHNCPPCRALAPVVDEISESGLIKVVKVDVDEAKTVASKYRVFSVPTLIIFKDGKPTDSRVGFASKAALEPWIQSKI